MLCQIGLVNESNQLVALFKSKRRKIWIILIEVMGLVHLQLILWAWCTCGCEECVGRGELRPSVPVPSSNLNSHFCLFLCIFHLPCFSSHQSLHYSGVCLHVGKRNRWCDLSMKYFFFHLRFISSIKMIWKEAQGQMFSLDKYNKIEE